MPIYSADREDESGIPQLARDFLAKITACDALIISFAEHNGSYSAAYKNILTGALAFDMKVYQNKPMVLLSTSPGAGGAASVLNQAKTSMPYFAGEVKASLSIPNFQSCFDPKTTH